MIHSGSRNIGYKIAKYYNEKAKELNQIWYSSVDPKWDLAFLPTDSELGNQYIKEMNYAVKFAFANRKYMMDIIKDILIEIFPNISFGEFINIAHNYAALENHYKKNVWVHRKGATRARKGEIGLIPGSMGSPSYIVKGLGNPESFMSCSHGAGRKMSRKKAIETLDLEQEKAQMNGIISGLRNQNDLDEAPGSYKDIHTVMDNQKDLVEIITELFPVINIKG